MGCSTVVLPLIYEDSRIVKATGSEIMLQTFHSLDVKVGGEDVRLLMKGRLFKRAGDDYIILTIEIINDSPRPVTYNFAL